MDHRSIDYSINQSFSQSINQSTTPSLSLVSHFLQAGQLSFIKRPSYMYPPLTWICEEAVDCSCCCTRMVPSCSCFTYSRSLMRYARLSSRDCRPSIVDLAFLRSSAIKPSTSLWECMWGGGEKGWEETCGERECVCVCVCVCVCRRGV